MRRPLLVGSFVALVFLISACTGASRVPFTLRDQEVAVIAGYHPPIRTYVDGSTDELERRAADFLPPPQGHRPQFLAISGGGAAGAFGAGVLNGWTASGTRPDFDLVTGISVGGLIAPFAFLGSKADEELASLFTSGIAESLNRRNSVLQALTGPSLLKGRPLQSLIASYVDAEFLKAIAERHRSGARLLNLTTNLDAQRSVIWNMGAIAASGHSDSVALFRNILAASASVPGVFPAVKINATANGREFEELHADGAAAQSVFLFPDASGVTGYLPESLRRQRPDITLIVNTELYPSFEVVPNRTVATATRGINTVLKANSRDSVTRISAVARQNGLRFKLLYIDEPIPSSGLRLFDTPVMRWLFAKGEASARANGWRKNFELGQVTALDDG